MRSSSTSSLTALVMFPMSFPAHPGSFTPAAPKPAPEPPPALLGFASSCSVFVSSVLCCCCCSPDSPDACPGSCAAVALLALLSSDDGPASSFASLSASPRNCSVTLANVLRTLERISSEPARAVSEPFDSDSDTPAVVSRSFFRTAAAWSEAFENCSAIFSRCAANCSAEPSSDFLSSGLLSISLRTVRANSERTPPLDSSFFEP
mmetsp:Transcript_8321/g.27656  ORF Transcript_8321/g.27656 Transcript_8321/m.27656 type:complete len:206 (-) Transcript_8321:67-684(-)